MVIDTIRCVGCMDCVVACKTENQVPEGFNRDWIAYESVGTFPTIHLEIRSERGTRMATVDFGGIEKEVCLAYVPDLQVGEYTIVHVGFALTRLDEASALETLAMFAANGLLDEELGVGP